MFANLGDVCQSLWCLPNFHVTWRTRVIQAIPSPFGAFNTLAMILSPPVAFPDFFPLIAVATSATLKTSSSPKCSTSCVSKVDALQDSKPFQRIPSVVKGFHFHPLKCYLRNSWWSKWDSIICPFSFLLYKRLKKSSSIFPSVNVQNWLKLP